MAGLRKIEKKSQKDKLGNTLRLIECVVVRFLMKLLKTVNNEISNFHCQVNY